MADRKLSRAQAGLALASALVVLLASGVAISRLSDSDDESPSAGGPDSPSPATGAPTAPSPSLTGPGPDGSGGQGAVAETAPGRDQAASAPDPAAMIRRAQRSAAAAVGDSGAAAAVGSPAGSALSGPGSDGSPSGTSGGSGTTGTADGTAGGGQDGPPANGQGASPGGGQDGPPTNGQGAPPGGGEGAGPGGGQESPPAPSQDPSEPEALVSASVSVGEGSQGGVVGVGLVDTAPEVDVTVGTTPLVGDHPPAEGTGVALGGQLLQPSNSAPPG